MVCQSTDLACLRVNSFPSAEGINSVDTEVNKRSINSFPEFFPEPKHDLDTIPGGETPTLSTIVSDPLKIIVHNHDQRTTLYVNDNVHDHDSRTTSTDRIRNDNDTSTDTDRIRDDNDTSTSTDRIRDDNDTSTDTDRIRDENECAIVHESVSANANAAGIEGVGASPPVNASASGDGKEGINSPALSTSGDGKEGINSPISVDDNAPVNSFPSLAPEAYHGIIGDIVRVIEPETEADPAGILVTLLTHVGNAIGRGTHFVVGTTRHHANTFACIVGDTASGKGIAESVVEYIMGKAVPDSRDAIGHGLSSGEGLIDRVRDDDPPDDDTQGVLTFAMPEEKRFLALETEFFRVVTAMRREGNTLSAILRSSWDGDILETLTRTRPGDKKSGRPSKPMRASNAHVSVIGHITPQELGVAMGKNGGIDLANGFANRFLWVSVERSKSLPEGGDASVLDDYAVPLAEAIETARRIGRVERDADAKSLWASVYDGLTETKPGAYGLVVGRGRAHVCGDGRRRCHPRPAPPCGPRSLELLRGVRVQDIRRRQGCHK